MKKFLELSEFLLISNHYWICSNYINEVNRTFTSYLYDLNNYLNSLLKIYKFLAKLKKNILFTVKGETLKENSKKTNFRTNLRMLQKFSKTYLFISFLSLVFSTTSRRFSISKSFMLISSCS